MIVTAEADSATLKSFRDPAGSVFRHRGRILRSVHAAFTGDLHAFLDTRAAREAVESGTLVRSSRLTGAELWELRIEHGLDSEEVYEHPRIPFASYPYEWPAEMLHAAGALTLDLASAAMEEGFGLKDATPYNVLFRGNAPVFVDVLSFERRDPRNATWMAYAQFVRTFLLPLAASKYFGATLGETLATRRDGLEPETVYRWAGWGRRLGGPLLGLVSIPHWLTSWGPAGARGESAALYRPKPAASPEQARFILRGLLNNCRKQLQKLAPDSNKSSAWTDYLGHKSLYTGRQLVQKEGFVREALGRVGSRTVLDVGANEGHFSFLAARTGASVVAIDSDPAVAGRIWKRATAEKLDVLPLVVNLARPTPAMGWRNRECASFLNRAAPREGRGFDAVLMLAVLHHLLVSERIPLEDLLAQAAELTRGYAVIEFIAPEDPMFQRIVRGREGLHADLTVERFERAARAHFDVVRSERIDGLHRWLYLLRRRD
jgi:SAM-dependent methyltransferase